MGEHLLNGSPSKRLEQVHIGLWLTTLHCAAIPQVPSHGSLHFWLRHASFNGHSLLLTHSGRHAGGLPMNPWTQEQTPIPFTSRHWLLGPHGDGLHGFSMTGANNNKTLSYNIYVKTIIQSNILWRGLQWTNAFPSIPLEHRHIGIWLNTSQTAFGAHVPGQGSLHLLRMQALSREQSELIVHSGRHPA